MKEYRIKNSKKEILGFVKSASAELAIQKTAWALNLNLNELSAEEV